MNLIMIFTKNYIILKHTKNIVSSTNREIRYRIKFLVIKKQYTINYT